MVTFLLFGELFCEAIKIYISENGKDAEECGTKNQPCLTMIYSLEKCSEKNEIAFAIVSRRLASMIPVEFKDQKIELYAETDNHTSFLRPFRWSLTPVFTTHSTNLSVKALTIIAEWNDNGTNPILSSDENSYLLLENVNLCEVYNGRQIPTLVESFITARDSSLIFNCCRIEDERDYEEKSLEEDVACPWKSGCIELLECKTVIENTTFSRANCGFVFQRGGSLELKNDSFSADTYILYSDFKRTVHCENKGSLSISSIRTFDREKEEQDDLWMDIGGCTLISNDNPGKYIYFHVNISSIECAWSLLESGYLKFSFEGYGFTLCREKVKFTFASKGATEKTVISKQLKSWFRTKADVEVEASEFLGASSVSVQFEYPSATGNGSGTEETPELTVVLPEKPDEREKTHAPGKNHMKTIILAIVCSFVGVVGAVVLVAVVKIMWERRRRNGERLKTEQNNVLYQANSELYY